MHNLALALNGSWKVLVAGLLLGAGLPVLFAAGVRSLGYAAAAGSRATSQTAPQRASRSRSQVVVGRSLGVACLAVVVVAVALGITFIVASGFGYTLSFGAGYPTLVAKH